MSESPTGLARRASRTRSATTTAPGSAVSTSTPRAANSPSRNTVSPSRIVRHATAPSTVERLVACRVRCLVQAVEPPEDDRDRLDLAACRRHDLLEHDGQVALADETGHRVDLPVVGRLAGGRPVAALGLDRCGARRRTSPVWTCACRSACSARIRCRSISAPTPAVRHADDRGDQPERPASSNEHGRDPTTIETAASTAHAASPQWETGRSARFAHRRERSAARSASSPTIWVRRKSLGV